METSKNTLNEKNISKKWISLSDTVKRYTNAFALSIGLIAWVQAWPTSAANFLSDSTVAISSPSKTSTLVWWNQSISYEDILYAFMEQDVGLIETIKEKIKNDCIKSWEVCDIEKQIQPLEYWEKVILSFPYISNKLSKWGVNLKLPLDKKNVSTILDLFLHIENIFKARYWENYMDILDKESIANKKYSLIINVKDGKNNVKDEKNWDFIIENIYLSENKKD